VDRRRAGRIGLAVALAGALILASAGPAPADPQTDKTRVDRELTQAQSVYESASSQAQSALAAYDETTQRLTVVQGTLADANGVVAARKAASTQAQRDAEAARTAQDAADRRLIDTATQVDQAQAAVSSLVSATYKGSGLLALTSLLETPSPSDLAERLSLVDRVAQRGQQALNSYLDAQVAAKEADNAAFAARKAADDAAGRARQALSAAQAAAEAAQRAADEVTALQAAQAAAAAAANAQRDATLAQYQDLQAQSDQLAAELRRLADQQRTPVSVAPSHGAYFLTPVHGWKSSDFGMRYDPYYHVYQLHAGVDLAAPEGTPIYAAAGGQVVRAGWNGGNGNYTCISHGLYQGQNLSTCYAHQSAMLVSVGQWVQRGQLIGRVGTTGASTGDHLHFEVRLNGTPVQPLNWLDACLC
jgi:murein DD-endopeptidase MepM/ murein hydrolase activator NlpD